MKSFLIPQPSPVESGCGNERNSWLLLFFLGALLLSYSGAAFAADELGDGTCALVKVLTGKWLFGFSILAILGGMSAILMGGEISDGIKKYATIITIIGIILSTPFILNKVFPSFAAVSCG